MNIGTDTHIIYHSKTSEARNQILLNTRYCWQKCIWDDNDVLAFNEEDKQKAWKQHYERLLNVESPWQEEDLSTADPILGPPLLITKEMVVKKMKNGKTSSS